MNLYAIEHRWHGQDGADSVVLAVHATRAAAWPIR
jgi:hypothetical protein